MAPEADPEDARPEGEAEDAPADDAADSGASGGKRSGRRRRRSRSTSRKRTSASASDDADAAASDVADAAAGDGTADGTEDDAWADAGAEDDSDADADADADAVSAEGDGRGGTEDDVGDVDDVDSVDIGASDVEDVEDGGGTDPSDDEPGSEPVDELPDARDSEPDADAEGASVPTSPGGTSRRRGRAGSRAERPAPGPRTAARRAARRTRFRRVVLTLLLGGGAVVLAVAVGPGVLDALQRDTSDVVAPATPDATDPDGSAPEEEVGLDPAPTALLSTVDGPQQGARATTVVVLGVDRASGRGTILLVPTTLATDVPGFGLLQLAGAEQIGGAELVALTLSNTLGLGFDTVATVTRQDWAALFGRVGGFEVEIRERLVVTDEDGGSEVRFEPGAQFLDGPRLAELLTLRQDGEPELAGLPRVQAVLEGFLAAASDGGIDAVLEDGAPMLRSSDQDALADVLRGLVAASGDDLVDVRTLPVTPIGAGDDASYRLDEAGAAALVADRFPDATTTPAADLGRGLRLEIRNGNGVPGSGARVTEVVVPLGHQVVLTGNADRFDVEETRVIVYDDDQEVVRAAQGIVDALGVGRVELSEVPQGISDATILVGRDFAS
jgi:anionic cell wall polymer biosynthesis LytR-Cps2A-Psr (LCP) family protein